MTVVRSSGAFLLAVLALAGAAGVAPAQESAAPDPGTRLVVFEDFNRFT